MRRVGERRWVGGRWLERPGNPRRRAARPERRPRPPRALAGCVALAALLASASGAVAGCRATEFLDSVGKEHLDLGRMESDIRARLQRRLEAGARSARGSVASVGRVRCRERSEIAATCRARVSRPGGRRVLRIEVAVDPDTGAYSWEVVN